MVEHTREDVGLARAGSDEHDARGVVDDWVRKRDPFGWGLRCVRERCDPPVLLREERVGGEERRGVAVRAHAEEDEVEDGEAGGVLLREGVDERLLVCVCELLEVAQLAHIDRVDLRGREGDAGEEGLCAGAVVGVGVVERDGALVDVEYVPVVPLDGTRGQRGEAGEHRGERAAGEGNGEAPLLVDGVLLGLGDERGELGDESGGVGEDGEERRVWGVVGHGGGGGLGEDRESGDDIRDCKLIRNVTLRM